MRVKSSFIYFFRYKSEVVADGHFVLIGLWVCDVNETNAIVESLDRETLGIGKSRVILRLNNWTISYFTISITTREE